MFTDTFLSGARTPDILVELSDGEVSKVSWLSTSGFTMTGDINMGQNEVVNLPDVPSRDHSAVSKKYVADNFCNTSSDTMTGT